MAKNSNMNNLSMHKHNQQDMNNNNNNNNNIQVNNTNNNHYQVNINVDDDTLLDDFSDFVTDDRENQYGKGSHHLDNIDPFLFMNNNQMVHNNYGVDYNYRYDNNFYHGIPLPVPMNPSIMLPHYNQNVLNTSGIETVNSKNSGKSSSGRSVNSRGSDSSNSRGGDDWKKLDINDPKKKREAEKKRQDRNSREQQRSFKISKQIDQLKALLDQSGIKVKNSKYDILAGVTGYVKHLQSRSQEIQKDIRSMDQQITVKSANIIPQETSAATTTTTTVVTNGSSSSHSSKSDHHTVTSLPVKHNLSDPFGVLPDRGFKQYFMQTTLPLALAASDGRLFECNQSFLDITGLQREHVLHASIFKLVDPTQLHEAYINIGSLLQDLIIMQNEKGNLKQNDTVIFKTESNESNQQTQQNNYDNDQSCNGNYQGNNSNGIISNSNNSRDGSDNGNKSNSKSQSNQLIKRFKKSSDNNLNADSSYSPIDILGLHSTKSFSVKSLIISAFDGKQLKLGIGIVLPESSKTICINNIQQPLFSVALVPIDEVKT